MRSSHARHKSVHVNPYIRYRFQRWENVCEHWRSFPYQYRLFE